MSNTHFLLLFITIVISSLFVASYVLLSYMVMPSSNSLRTWWQLINFPLLQLGGLWVPWAIMVQSIPILGYVALLNPIMHVTESMRSALLGQTGHLPSWITLGTLLIFSSIFLYTAVIKFNQRFDYP